ncbi:MAG: hypothetical protein AAFY57_16465 [Cyanobacteria bacterium J06642_2]
MKRLWLALLCTMGLTGVAKADHYYATADPQVVQAIDEIIMVLGQGCNVGNAPACNAIPLAQQQAHLMLSAGYECNLGNQQACGFYQQNLSQLSDAYQQLSIAVQQGRMTSPYGQPTAGMGLTHAERMQAIHNFGVQNRINFNNRMATMDANHQQFLEYLRQ